METMDNQKLIKYYQNAMENVVANPDSAVNSARKAAENVLKSIIGGAGKSFNQHATLENLLEQIKKSKINLNPKIELAVRTIQLYANYGAHDQGYQAEESAIIEHHDDLSSEDIKPCINALTQMLKAFLLGTMEDTLDELDIEISEQRFPENYIVKIGASNLTVPDSIMQGWRCEDVFAKFNMEVQRISRKWNDQILADLDDNTLDMAIYNRESTLHYISEHPDSGIHILRDVCSSMGGRNFYILASKKGKWADMTLQQFKDSLAPGVIIAVSRNSDMEKNLLYIIDKSLEELRNMGVMLFDYHSDQGLAIFDMNPDILVIGGQDLRFLAESKGEYIEVVSYENLPASKKEFFDRNSVNSLVVGSTLYNMYPKDVLNNIADQLMINFYSSNISETSRKIIRDRLRPQVRQISPDDKTADYIVQRILFETYRFF